MDKILLIVVVVLLVALMVISYVRKKKYNSELTDMRKDLKVGDKVMTDTGVIGELVESFEEDGYKYFVLKSGRDSHVGYFTVHANAIYYVFGKEKPLPDADIKPEQTADTTDTIVTKEPQTVVDGTVVEDKPAKTKQTKNKSKKK